ncbi:hypothetical protein GCM10007414_14420 [Agarivorans gilvus]|uniref:Mechanosensitive ion channel protein MscS n=1 Tax=Agarivorans gilvus TaxID=680279 RepID=A0ABQ1I0Q4_9ALTE|nr:hypothetical protein GCM10007414_14420 [Agarivorans gilvus]
MEDYIQNLDVNQYFPMLVSGATNVLIAALILIVGVFIAKKVDRLICDIGAKYQKLDDTLFRFLGSLGKYVY